MLYEETKGKREKKKKKKKKKKTFFLSLFSSHLRDQSEHISNALVLVEPLKQAQKERRKVDRVRVEELQLRLARLLVVRFDQLEFARAQHAG
jgi:hypothetical protein